MSDYIVYSQDDTKTDIANEVTDLVEEFLKQKQIINEAQSKIENLSYILRRYMADIKVAEMDKVQERKLGTTN